jgi:uncharacterized protein (TIGR03437 family)
MHMRAFLCLALSSAAVALSASNFPLAVDYSEWLNLNALQIATDDSGALYIASGPLGGWTSSVTKLSADGKTLLWQYQLGFSAVAMAVDPNGGVYVIPISLPGDTSIYVAKLTSNGTGLAWKTPVGFISPSAIGGQFPPILGADSQGRAYVAGSNGSSNGEADVVRLNAAGNAVDYTAQVSGTPTAMAIDSSGAAFVAGFTASQNAANGFLARLAPDGSAGFYVMLPGQNLNPTGVGLDAGGDAIVLRGGTLQTVDPTGAVTLSTTVNGGSSSAVDSSGNAYITVLSSQNVQVKNNIATCGTDNEWLTVLAPDGSLQQTTYVPGGQFGAFRPLIATGPNSTVFVVNGADTNYTPTQAGPFPAGSSGSTFLLRLSPNANARILPLACMVNGASFATGPIAPGEIVTLYGAGLGPQQGVQTQATTESPFPTLAAGVEVTFDGIPAPLLWVQDTQINVVAPWSLTPGQNTQVCASYNQVSTNCLTSPVVQSAPAVFTVDGVNALAMNQDGSTNSANNPAPVGSIITIWATGLGPVTPVPADGALVQLPLPQNVLPVDLQGSWCFPFTCTSFPTYTVTYAGPAPYLVSGASQINFQVVLFGGEISLFLPSTQSPGFGIYVANQ